MVLTGRLKAALETLELAYAAKIPALIEGAAGVGKTILVESFATLQNQTGIYTLGRNLFLTLVCRCGDDKYG